MVRAFSVRATPAAQGTTPVASGFVRVGAILGLRVGVRRQRRRALLQAWFPGLTDPAAMTS